MSDVAAYAAVGPKS